MDNQELLNQLKDKNTDDVKLFSLDGQTLYGKVVEIYDGDTCKIIVCLNNTLQKFNCRLFGLDTPEIKPLISKPDRETEILNAHKSRNRLLQLATTCNCNNDTLYKKSEIKKILDLNKKILIVKCYEFDKYGRLLVELIDNEININKTLIDEGFAKEYFGGTKL